MNIKVHSQECQDDFNELVLRVREYNSEKVGVEKVEQLSVLIRDDNDNIVAGVAGKTVYKHFFIGVVWVGKSFRGQGIGSKLMQLAEEEAIKRGCIGAQVDTLAFQAPEFYKKLGFVVVGHAQGVTEKHDRYFLMKHY